MGRCEVDNDYCHWGVGLVENVTSGLQENRPTEGLGYLTLHRADTQNQLHVGWCSPSNGDGRRAEVGIDIAHIRNHHPDLYTSPMPTFGMGGM